MPVVTVELTRAGEDLLGVSAKVGGHVGGSGDNWMLCRGLAKLGMYCITHFTQCCKFHLNPPLQHPCPVSYLHSHFHLNPPL